MIRFPLTLGLHQNHHDPNLLDHRIQCAFNPRLYAQPKQFHLWPPVSEDHHGIGLQPDDWPCVDAQRQYLGSNGDR